MIYALEIQPKINLGVKELRITIAVSRVPTGSVHKIAYCLGKGLGLELV